MEYLSQDLHVLYSNSHLFILILVMFVHMLSALAVSKDVGDLTKRNIGTCLMPRFSWIISVLITGIWGLLIYWLIHHSSLSRK